MSDPPSHIIPLPFFAHFPKFSTISAIIRLFLFLLKPSRKITILSPLIREHHDSYLYYLDTHSVIETTEQPPFSIPFISPINQLDTFRKKIHPHNIFIPIAHVFTTFLNNVQEKK